MAYAVDVAALVRAHREEVEADLVAARQAHRRCRDEEQRHARRVASLEALLTLAAADCEEQDGGVTVPGFTLHEAMREVLLSARQRRHQPRAVAPVCPPLSPALRQQKDATARLQGSRARSVSGAAEGW